MPLSIYNRHWQVKNDNFYKKFTVQIKLVHSYAAKVENIATELKICMLDTNKTPYLGRVCPSGLYKLNVD